MDNDRIRRPSARSQRGLDWFAFFLADIQTGWGPFLAAYLSSAHWSQLNIGLVLTIGTLAAMALQIPIGALVDHVASKRALAAAGVTAISGSALLVAWWPTFEMVVGAKLLHAIASCLMGPVLAAISLGLVGHALLGVRLGRNARFLALGNAVSAGAMGAIAYFYSNQAIFIFTAALAIPTLVALAQIQSSEINPRLARGETSESGGPWLLGLRKLMLNRALLVFATAIVLFQIANAAMLPILAGALAQRSPQSAAGIIAICILVPQFAVVAIAPWVGRLTHSWGRRPLLMISFLPLCVRGLVFAGSQETLPIVLVQLLDGISAAALGILVPLIIADTTRGSSHFGFAQGVIGVAVGIGASISTTLAAFVADLLGNSSAFLFLALVGAIGALLVFLLMPETREGPAERSS